MRDLTGFRYVERLLADPGREFHVLDLVAVDKGTLPTGPTVHHGLDAVTEGIGVQASPSSMTRPATPTAAGWPKSTMTSRRPPGPTTSVASTSHNTTGTTC